jgi:predicted GNAT family N-acyltransferase
VPLYERAGYTVRGEVFDDAGIDHVRMEKRRA